MNFYEEFYEYFEEVKKYPKLTNEKVAEIFRNKSREDAIREIVERNHQLVCYMVLRWGWNAEKYNIDLMDLVQAGNLGLYKGTQKYDPTKSKNYFIYITSYIKSYIEKEFFKHTIYSRIEGKRRVKNHLDLNPVDSLSAPVSDNGEDDPLLLEDTISHPSDNKIFALIDAKNLLVVLKKANGKIHHLSEKIIEFRFAVGSRRYYEPLSLSETGKMVNLSRESIRKIERKTLSYLRSVIS